MKGKVELSKITIRMGDNDVDLTIDQARELGKLLNDLFNTSSPAAIIEKHEHHYNRYNTWPYYSQPYTPSYPQFWCQSANTTGATTKGYNLTLALKD